MPIPDDVTQALNDAKMAWNKLGTSVPQNKANWSVEQQRALGLHAEIAMHTYNAVNRLATYLFTPGTTL